MEPEGGIDGAQVPRTSPAEGAREVVRPQRTRKRRAWTAEEDAVLAAHVQDHGVTKWDAVPELTGLERTGQSCRFRWLNSLRPGLKDGVAFSPDEEVQLCRLHAALGNKWSRIAAEMEGRSENEVMRYWFSYVDRCQQTGLNGYLPEVPAAAGQSALRQPQRKRHKSRRNSSLSQQPPAPPHLVPVGNPDYPVAPSTHPSQPLGADYPLTMATAPPRLPVMAKEGLSDDQFWASLLSFSNRNVEQGMQPQPPVLPLGNAMNFNEKDPLLELLLWLSAQNAEQGRQPQPPAPLLGNATEFNEESRPSSSLLPQSNQNVEQVRQPQPPALPLENATECNQEGQLLTNQNVEQGRQLPSPVLPSEDGTEFNEEDQNYLASLLPRLSVPNAEQERQPPLPALPHGNATEFNEEDQLLTSLRAATTEFEGWIGEPATVVGECNGI